MLPEQLHIQNLLIPLLCRELALSVALLVWLDPFLTVEEQDMLWVGT